MSSFFIGTRNGTIVPFNIKWTDQIPNYTKGTERIPIKKERINKTDT